MIRSENLLALSPKQTKTKAKNIPQSDFKGTRTRTRSFDTTLNLTRVIIREQEVLCLADDIYNNYYYHAYTLIALKHLFGAAVIAPAEAEAKP